MSKWIWYKAGYKYQLAHDTSFPLEYVHYPKRIETEYITWDAAVEFLDIKKGYAWDGPSGPAIDTSNFMRGSLVHDALYQLIRQGHLPPHYRRVADKELKRLCLEDGMSRIRAWWVYETVRLFAGPAARGPRTVFCSPNTPNRGDRRKARAFTDG